MRDDVIFPFKQKDADLYHQSDIISDFNSFQMFLTSSIVLHCGFSAFKLKVVMILV